MGNKISSAVGMKRREDVSVIDKLTEAQLDEFREAFNSFDKVCAGCGLRRRIGKRGLTVRAHAKERGLRLACIRALVVIWPPRSHAAHARSGWRRIHRCQRAEGPDGVGWAEPDR